MAEKKQPEPKPKKSQCESCPRKFRHPYLLIRHVRAALERELPNKKLGIIGLHTSDYHDRYLEVIPSRADEETSVEKTTEELYPTPQGMGEGY